MYMHSYTLYTLRSTDRGEQGVQYIELGRMFIYIIAMPDNVRTM